MASRGLGTLTVNVIANIGGFTQGMNQMQRAAATAVNNVTTQLSRLTTAMKNVALVGSAFVVANFAAVTAAITASAKAGIDAADKFDELSARLSISVETLSSMAYAAEMSGVSLDDLAAVFPKLSKFMAASLDPGSKAAQIMKTLGLSAVDASGNLKSADVMLLEIATRFKDFDDATGEAALAMEIFGKSGVTLLEFLNRGGDGISEMQDRAKSLGLVFSSETAAASAELNDRLAELGMATQVLGATIATDLLPRIVQTIEYFQNLSKDGKSLEVIVEFLGGAIDLVKISLNFLSVALSGAIANITAIITIVDKAINAIKILGNTVINTAKALANFNPMGAIDAQINGVKQMFQNGMDGVQELAETQDKHFRNSAKNMNQAWHTLNGTMTESERIAERQAKASAKAADAAERAQNISLMPDTSGATNWNNAWTKSIDDIQREKQKVDNASFLDPQLKQVPKSIFDGSEKGGGSSKAAKAAKTQLTEEQKEAQKLEEKYKSLLEQMKERTALIGVTTEEGKLLYDMEHGELSKLLPAKKEELLVQARLYDARNEQYKKDEEERKKKEREVENLKSISEELNFQLEILGKTREEQEKIALLKDLGSQATTEEGKALVAQLEHLQQQQKIVANNVELSDTIRNSFVDSFKGLVDGSLSAKDAVLGFLDSINAKILDMIANNWAEKLFGQFGSSMGGSVGSAGGGGWFQSLMGMFGGGRATGGPVGSNKMYRVNENGPEMLSVAGKDFLMMGRNGGRVTSNQKLSGGGISQTNNFTLQGKIDRRTEQQIAFELQRSAVRAMNRNS